MNFKSDEVSEIEEIIRSYKIVSSEVNDSIGLKDYFRISERGNKYYHEWLNRLSQVTHASDDLWDKGFEDWLYCNKIPCNYETPILYRDKDKGRNDFLP